MGTGHRPLRLHIFVLGSLAVHALLFAAGSQPLRFGAAPQPPLSVHLEGEHEADQAARRPGARADRTVASNERVHRTADAAEPAPVAARTDIGRDSPAAGARATGNDDELRARIEARARLDLARHFEYPYVARLRGWEGDVLLGFVVQASGRLDAVRVLRGSGFAVLDRSAVDSLRRVARLPEAVARLNGRDLEMRLPIVYRLEGER